MQTIDMGQNVASNEHYKTCESGEFEDLSFVMCVEKLNNNPVMFLAVQINNNESSS
ncbi:MAG: hypothetical protein ACK54Y_09120 [Bacteroidota bacterium]|jgi:poly-D-alanine transfer protein DltD